MKKEKINKLKDVKDGLIAGLVAGLIVGLIAGLIVGLMLTFVTQFIAFIQGNLEFSMFNLIASIVLIVVIEIIGWSIVKKW